MLKLKLTNQKNKFSNKKKRFFKSFLVNFGDLAFALPPPHNIHAFFVCCYSVNFDFFFSKHFKNDDGLHVSRYNCSNVFKIEQQRLTNRECNP